MLSEGVFFFLIWFSSQFATASSSSASATPPTQASSSSSATATPPTQATAPAILRHLRRRSLLRHPTQRLLKTCLQPWPQQFHRTPNSSELHWGKIKYSSETLQTLNPRMLAASMWFKRVSQCKPKSYLSNIEPTVCSNCQINRLILREPANGKRKWWFDKDVNGYLLKYSNELQRRRLSQHTNFVTSILVVSWIWPYHVNTSIGIYQSVATQASPSEEELTDEFLNRLLSAIENDPISTRETCTAYIEKLCRARKLSVAARLLQSLRDKRIFLTTNAYNLLLVTAGEENDIGLVCQIFKDLLASWEPICSTSYLNIAKAFINTNDAGLLLRFIKEVSELTFPRSVVIINRIVFAFAECGQTDKALLIFDHMKSLKCKPDLVTYNTVLETLGRVGRADEMLHEFASMKEANIAPDIISYNTLINSLRKLGRLGTCLVFLKEMEERGFEPDLLTYNALIESFGRSGNVEASLRLFNEMKSRGIRPSIYIYRSLINNLKKMGKLELATTLLEEMTASLSNLVGPKDFRRKNR